MSDRDILYRADGAISAGEILGRRGIAVTIRPTADILQDVSTFGDMRCLVGMGLLTRVSSFNLFLTSQCIEE